MNNILWNIKLNYKKNIIMIVGLMVFLIASLIKFESFKDTPEVFSIMNKMPKVIQSLIGYQPNLDLSKYLDYNILVYYYLNLILGIFVIYKASNLLKEDLVNKNTEFLYTLAQPRITGFKAKYLSDMIFLIVVFLVCLFTNFMAVGYLNIEVDIVGLIVLNICLLLNSIFIYNLSIYINKFQVSQFLFLLSFPLLFIYNISDVNYLKLFILNEYFSLDTMYLSIKLTLLIMSIVFINKQLKKIINQDLG